MRNQVPQIAEEILADISNEPYHRDVEIDVDLMLSGTKIRYSGDPVLKQRLQEAALAQHTSVAVIVGQAIRNLDVTPQVEAYVARLEAGEPISIPPMVE